MKKKFLMAMAFGILAMLISCAACAAGETEDVPSPTPIQSTAARAEEAEGTAVVLSDDGVTVDGQAASTDPASAVYVGAGKTHTREYFVNAMMEAVCYSLRMELDDYTKDSGGLKVEKMGAIGGGAQSDHWMQMMANATGIPVSVPENCRHSGAIGSAVIVCVGKGLYKMEEIGRFVRVEKTFYPDPEKKAVYDRQYAVWQKLYPALKDIFADLY